MIRYGLNNIENHYQYGTIVSITIKEILIMDKRVLASTDDLQIKLCCGCGVVNLNVGPLQLKLTKEAFLNLATRVDGVAEMMRASANSSSCGDSPPFSFADQKFLA
jgi:hypothetical protein